jgi:hypothetical protein
MQLLTAPDDDNARWSALIAGTREVLDRFERITAPKIICATGEFVIDQLSQCASIPGLPRDVVRGLAAGRGRRADSPSTAAGSLC